MNQHLQKILSIIQEENNLPPELKDSISKSLKAADKELELALFKLDRTEKVKRTTSILLEETIQELEQKRKAVEAQNRELEVEAALEKVRARTMAMFRSAELIEIISTVFQQLEQLKFKIGAVSLSLNYKENPFNFWTAISGLPLPIELNVPYANIDFMNRLLENAGKNEQLYIETFTARQKNEWVNHLFSHTLVGHADEEKKRMMLEAPGLALSVAATPTVALAISNYELHEYSEEENRVLIRFVHVFEQSYTRFIDLQKAEAQARLAQIEAALERVRSKAMAMHNSQDLADTIGVFYSELQSFSITPRRCGVGLLDKNSRSGEIFSWNTTEQGESLELIGRLRMEGHPVLNNVYEYWIAQQDYYPVLRGQEIAEYYKIIRPQWDPLESTCRHASLSIL